WARQVWGSRKGTKRPGPQSPGTSTAKAWTPGGELMNVPASVQGLFESVKHKARMGGPAQRSRAGSLRRGCIAGAVGDAHSGSPLSAKRDYAGDCALPSGK